MFSGVVQIADINDFINPSQSCVKPILTDNKSDSTKINLIDCLACNGCITSAESILIEEHSLKKFYTISKNKLNIICLSQQSLESLSYKYSLNEEKIIKLITKILNIDLLFKLDEFILYTLNLCYKEFKNENNCIITSECPGWICYAEKKVGNEAFKYMSKIKSPQQIFSILIRSVLKDKFGNDDNYFISSIMPCFDKKIESVRNKDEINCVISTIELCDEIDKVLKDFNYNDIKNVKVNFSEFKKLIDNCNCNNLSEFKLYFEKNIKDYKFENDYHTKINFSSNGYCEFILSKIEEENNNYIIERKDGKNKDIKEIIIYKDNSKNEIYKKLCIAYGFRNIQNIVRNIKRNKLDYDYIELMACPGGCINGGGQIKENNQNRELLKLISEKLKNDNNIISFKNSEFKINDLLNIKVEENNFKQNFKAIEYTMSDLKW
jgi:iron only hydrogenase large subunit-like protein